MPLDVCLPTLAHVQDDANFSLDPPDPMPVAEETAVSISDEDAGGEGDTRRKTKASAPGQTPQSKTDSPMFMYVHVAHDYLRDCIDHRPADPNLQRLFVERNRSLCRSQTRRTDPNFQRRKAWDSFVEVNALPDKHTLRLIPRMRHD